MGARGFSRGRALVGVLGAALAAVGCGDDGSGSGTAPPDAGPPDAGPALIRCGDDTACDDGVFCNGRELCRPWFESADAEGCVPGPPPCLGGQQCREEMGVCETECAVDADADGDGVDATECGGLDCDDSDPLSFPGNLEVCDALDRDEDCDPTTFGTRDLDFDGYVDAKCCNVRPDGTRSCGDDCADLIFTANPAADELCDGFDNDCDGEIDEGVTSTVYVDADRDGHGDPERPLEACPGATGVSALGDDCDDTDAARRPTLPELCDEIDNDCDGLVDERPTSVPWYRDLDGDGFGSALSGRVVSCAPVAGHVLLDTDCDDARASVNPAAAEQCNGRDDDCNGLADFAFPGRPGDVEDDDGDGFADAACPGGADCDDDDPFAYPGAAELCDLRDNDCDAEIDEVEDAPVWYSDLDGDGWGAGAGTPSCTILPGLVLRGGDCDDDDPFRRPGLPDGCNGVDDDCDVAVDEDAEVFAYYVDLDEDGVGSGDPIGMACAPPVGSASSGGDCDDFDPFVSPALPELCDGLDNDCDGFVDEEPSASASCRAPRSVTACTAAACSLESCSVGYDDCNADLADGCEAELATSSSHCGACGEPCADLCEATACGDTDAVAIGRSAGTHNCLVRSSGAVVCWGDNDYGQLGTGSLRPPDERDFDLPRASVVGLDDAIEVVVGERHSCALRAGGEVACWGGNGEGQLARPRPVFGFDSPTPGALAVSGVARSAEPLAVPGVSDAVALQAVARGTCALRETGRIACWGRGPFARSVTEVETVEVTPVTVPGVTDAIDLSSGSSFLCALREGGSVVCWGTNGAGNLGDGTTTDRPRPRAVRGLRDATAVAAGGSHACAIRASGAVMCWGLNSDGQLGAGDSTSSSVPVDVVGVDDAREVFAGSSHTCVLREDPEDGGFCWGDGRLFGTSGDRLTPISYVNPDRTIEALALGAEATCGILDDGLTYCQGRGAAGDGDLDDGRVRYSPRYFCLAARDLCEDPAELCVDWDDTGDPECRGWTTDEGAIDAPDTPEGVTTGFDASSPFRVTGSLDGFDVDCWGVDVELDDRGVLEIEDCEDGPAIYTSDSELLIAGGFCSIPIESAASFVGAGRVRLCFDSSSVRMRRYAWSVVPDGL